MLVKIAINSSSGTCAETLLSASTEDGNISELFSCSLRLELPSRPETCDVYTISCQNL